MEETAKRSVFSCFVIDYSHFKRCFKKFDGPMTLEQIPAADLLEAFAVLWNQC